MHAVAAKYAGCDLMLFENDVHSSGRSSARSPRCDLMLFENDVHLPGSTPPPPPRCDLMLFENDVHYLVENHVKKKVVI